MHGKEILGKGMGQRVMVVATFPHDGHSLLTLRGSEEGRRKDYSRSQVSQERNAFVFLKLFSASGVPSACRAESCMLKPSMQAFQNFLCFSL